MKLLTDLNEEATILTEGEGASKKYYLEGITLQGDIANRNKRCYPMKVLKPEVERYIREYVEQNRAVGELGHPQGPTINLDKVSHRFLSLREDGNNYIGKVMVLDTPNGKITQNLIEGGVKIGISSRALGSLKKNSKGINEVQNDLMIATAGDLVADPSAPDAFMSALYEQADWVYESGKWTSKMIEDARKSLLKTNKQDLEVNAFNMFEAFINGLK